MARFRAMQLASAPRRGGGRAGTTWLPRSTRGAVRPASAQPQPSSPPGVFPALPNPQDVPPRAVTTRPEPGNPLPLPPRATHPTRERRPRGLPRRRRELRSSASSGARPRAQPREHPQPGPVSAAAARFQVSAGGAGLAWWRLPGRCSAAGGVRAPARAAAEHPPPAAARAPAKSRSADARDAGGSARPRAQCGAAIPPARQHPPGCGRQARESPPRPAPARPPMRCPF